jgi:hypothetical protein
MSRTLAVALPADDQDVRPARTTIGFAIIVIAALLAIAVASTPTVARHPHHGTAVPASAAGGR